ncbi:M23 family metallopeptidase [Sphingomonas sp. MMS24-J45]|uniref:M23 family metallopeptidase n=1 Tax=Sphingomonas sp. MMS24-J45 TaxID=3238806 RepID=UPI00384BB38C
MRRIGWGLAILLVVLIGLWIAALKLLPGVPGEVASAPPAPMRHDEAAVLTVPVAGVPRRAITDSWGDDRDGGARPHHGTDIVAPAGTPVVAAAPGRIEKLFTSAAGGTTVYVRSPDRRWTYYYAHLAAYAPGLQEGQVVTSGDRLGFVGDTGNAGAGNYHLHFGLTRTDPQQRWYEGTDIDPYPYLAGKPLPR